MLDITLEETKLYQGIKAEGEVDVILRQLRKRFGNLSEDIQSSIFGAAVDIIRRTE